MRFGYRTGRTATTVGIEADGVQGGRNGFPNSIESCGCIGSITTSGRIGCRGCRTACTPPLESVTASCRHGCSQSERHIVSFGLTCRSSATTVGVITYRIGCCRILLPYRIHCRRGVGCIATTCTVGCSSCCRACRPALEGVSASSRYGCTKCQRYIVSLGLAGRCATTAVSIVGYRVSLGSIGFPNGIQSSA